MKSYLEQAFGRGDVTSARMQAAIREWLNLYYGTQSPGEDAADRLAVLVVSKLCRTVFAEYESRTAEALAPSLQALDAVRVQAMQYALVGAFFVKIMHTPTKIASYILSFRIRQTVAAKRKIPETIAVSGISFWWS